MIKRILIKTVFLSKIEPFPFKCTILFFLNKNSIPFVRVIIDLFLLFIIFDRFSLTPLVSMPKLLNSCLALLYISDRLSRLFEGIQPIFKQVPPNVFLDSTQAVLSPN